MSRKQKQNNYIIYTFQCFPVSFIKLTKAQARKMYKI